MTGNNVANGNPVRNLKANITHINNHFPSYRKCHNVNSDHKWSGSRFWPHWKVTDPQNCSRHSPPTPFNNLKIFQLISDWFRGMKVNHQTPNMASFGWLKACHLDVLWLLGRPVPFKAFWDCQIIFRICLWVTVRVNSLCSFYHKAVLKHRCGQEKLIWLVRGFNK